MTATRFAWLQRQGETDEEWRARLSRLLTETSRQAGEASDALAARSGECAELRELLAKIGETS